MKFRTLLVAALSVALLAVTGCQSNGGPNCTQIKAAYTAAQNVVDKADQVVVNEQATLAQLPANDPIRKTLEPQLQKSQQVAIELQVAAQVARAAVAALCPELPVIPVTVPSMQPASTQPSAP